MFFFSRENIPNVHTQHASRWKRNWWWIKFFLFFVLKIKKFPEGKQVEGPLRVSSSDGSRRKMWESNIQIASNLLIKQGCRKGDWVTGFVLESVGSLLIKHLTYISKIETVHLKTIQKIQFSPKFRDFFSSVAAASTKPQYPQANVHYQTNWTPSTLDEVGAVRLCHYTAIALSSGAGRANANNNDDHDVKKVLRRARGGEAGEGWNGWIHEAQKCRANVQAEHERKKN